MNRVAAIVDDINEAEQIHRPRRSHSERREEAEQRMVEAAVRIVAERGLQDLTLAECGEAAGYSRGLAAHYFGSKEALITAIATRIVRNYTKQLRSSGRGLSGLTGLLQTISFYIESGSKNLTWLRAFQAVLGSALTHPPLAVAIAQLNRDSINGFATMIGNAIERGEIRADVNPKAQATLILASLRGVLALWLLDAEHVDLDAARKEMLANLRRCLAA